MLHEILLSLSGLPSPIWEDLRNGRTPQDDGDDVSLGSLTSPAEKAMVEVLAELAHLHIKVRDATSIISTSHPSPICRAISTRIRTHHLRAFVEKVIHVETSILDQDAAYVGAYRIVPLSTIVSDFQPWARPLRWLWKTVQPSQRSLVETPSSCSGAVILRSLRNEAYTGYTDLKNISEDLLVVGQQAWVHTLMPWILYGQIPSFGAADFMIQAGQPDDECCLRNDLVPYFITPATAETILSIGLALQQITPRTGLSQKTSNLTKSCTALMPTSLQQIKSLQYPLKDTSVSNVVTFINDTISQAALSVILPVSVILDLLLVLQEYLLLRDGEFSTCLIQQAEKYLAAYQARSEASNPIRKLGKLSDLNINDAETSAVLDKTWAELSAFVPEKDSESQLRDKAANLLRLAKPATSLPVSSLLPNAASLVLQLPLNSPMSIFMSAADIDCYRTLSAYLISIRRAEFQLTKLWREPTHRRCHPTPIGPPRSATRQGQHILVTRRRREDRRARSMRQHWASISQALFLISELGSYFHGEVMQKSWEQLYTWLDIDTSSRPATSKTSSRPTTSSSQRPATHVSPNHTPETTKHSRTRKNDPRTIALAHRKYLDALTHSLLLSNTTYTTLLSTLLHTTDHYVALFHRLQPIWTALDLQEDESITSAFSNYPQEETEIMAEMKRTNTNITGTVHDLISAIRDIEKQRDLPDLSTGTAQLNMSGTGEDGSGAFEPWRARTLDRLLMKLDSLAGDDRSDQYEDALVELEES